MPSKQTITRDQIIDSAFNIVREKGYQNLTARNIAKDLNCSTMPIYSQFDSMDSLHAEVAGKSLDLLLRYQLSEGDKSTILTISTGMLQFALDEKELYKVMMLNDDPGQEKIRREMRDRASQKLDQILINQSAPDHDTFLNTKKALRKLLIFTQGLIVSYLFAGVIIGKDELENLLLDYHRLECSSL